MRVFVPVCTTDSDEELVIKYSIDGKEWTEQEPVYQPNLKTDTKVCPISH